MCSIDGALGVCIAIDPGTVRHGLAISDALGISAVPYGIVDAVPETDAVETIVRILKKKKAAVLVMGLPLNMDGTEGPSAKFARDLAESIQDIYTIDTVFMDERLTTVEAESQLSRRGMNWKQQKRYVDSKAAQIILADYLNTIR